MTLVKHIEQQVIRDQSGRIMSTTSHEWPEGHAHAAAHAAAVKEMTDERDSLAAERDALREKSERLTNDMQQLFEFFKRQGDRTEEFNTQLADSMQKAIEAREQNAIEARDALWVVAMDAREKEWRDALRSGQDPKRLMVEGPK